MGNGNIFFIKVEKVFILKSNLRIKNNLIKVWCNLILNEFFIWFNEWNLIFFEKVNVFCVLKIKYFYIRLFMENINIFKGWFF